MIDITVPIFRWAGGKVKLIQYLLDFVPTDYFRRTYWEPFLGGGSMFFALKPKRAILSDLNHHLIKCYKLIRRNPQLISHYLTIFQRLHSETFYYQVREEYNRSDFDYKQAARFIYLNRTSYNGIFRVNLNGEYNVPSGKIRQPRFPSVHKLKLLSKCLKRAKLLSAPYTEIMDNAIKGDFIYMDPPYPPLNGSSYFTHYTKERFTSDDQVELCAFATRLDSKGCLVMISNADIPFIRKLFKNWNLKSIPVTRWITCKSRKHKAHELIITNYHPYSTF